MDPLLRFKALLMALGLVVLPAIAQAQYMFLDMDGDGAYTDVDTRVIPSNGTIDLYFVADKDPWGGPAGCADGSGIDLYSYTVNLFAPGDSVRFSNVQNMMPGMTVATPLVTYPFALTVGYAGSQVFGPGTWHLLRFDIEFLGGYGCPVLSIVPSSCYSPAGVVTSIGSNCPGVNGDYLRLGIDFWAAQGFMCTDMGGHRPAVACPGEIHGREGEELSFQVTVTDPECGERPFTYWTYGVPTGAVVTPLSAFQLGEATLDVTWTPAPGQAGDYTFTVVADKSDWFNWFNRAQCSTRIVVGASNGRPIASAGGPYNGVEGLPVTFQGSRSSDPDGDPLSFAWTFGDGASAADVAPQHVYSTEGEFTVALTVSDPGELSDADSTTASIASVLPANVFTTANDDVTRLDQGKPFTCFRLEPGPGASYEAATILPASLWFHTENGRCGDVTIYPETGKKLEIRDADRDGVDELQLCIGDDAWGPLAGCLTPGEQEVSLELRGSLITGEPILAVFTHVFVTGPPELSAHVSPNPLSFTSTLEFTTRSTGFVRARLFDVRGRFLGVLHEEPVVYAGSHRIPLSGYFGQRAGLSSGIYFVLIETEHDGSTTKAVTIVR